MLELEIKIKSFGDVKLLNRLAQENEFDIDIREGRYIIDAKSILGIYSLNFLNPLKICIYENSDNEKVKDFISKISHLIV